jgi:hypothetical protein
MSPSPGPMPKISTVRSELLSSATAGRSTTKSKVKLSPMSTSVAETAWLATSVIVTIVSSKVVPG